MKTFIANDNNNGVQRAVKPNLNDENVLYSLSLQNIKQSLNVVFNNRNIVTSLSNKTGEFATKEERYKIYAKLPQTIESAFLKGVLESIVSSEGGVQYYIRHRNICSQTNRYGFDGGNVFLVCHTKDSKKAANFTPTKVPDVYITKIGTLPLGVAGFNNPWLQDWVKVSKLKGKISSKPYLTSDQLIPANESFVLLSVGCITNVTVDELPDTVNDTYGIQVVEVVNQGTDSEYWIMAPSISEKFMTGPNSRLVEFLCKSSPLAINLDYYHKIYADRKLSVLQYAVLLNHCWQFGKMDVKMINSLLQRLALKDRTHRFQRIVNAMNEVKLCTEV